MLQIKLVNAAGVVWTHTLNDPQHRAPSQRPWTRQALAAAHLVVDPRRVHCPITQSAIDWDASIAYRQHLWRYGFGVAEAMDTAQRGMGLDWPQAITLIERSMDAARDYRGIVNGPLVAAGAGTDHLLLNSAPNIDAVIAAYEMQCAAIERTGARIILMASRALAACARSADDYLHVYDRILSQVRQPVIIHWLGEMFDPALAGYWGSRDIHTAMHTCVQVLQQHATKIDGIKISLLDQAHEITLRRRLPAGVRMYTGDDFNFAELIAGDTHGYSDALLGIFDAIAPAASQALEALALGDLPRYQAILAPTVALSREIFSVPTRFYKTGIVFLAWLNGHQDHFTMLDGQQSARSITHLSEVFRLADLAGLFNDPPRAVGRMRALLALHGID